jgi:hypothetical protein
LYAYLLFVNPSIVNKKKGRRVTLSSKRHLSAQGTSSGVTGSVRGRDEFAFVSNHVFFSVSLVVEVAVQDFLHTISVSSLGREGGAGVVRSHGVSGHLSPGVVGRGRLGEPHITSVSLNVASLYSLNKSISVHDLTSSSVDNVGSLLHLGDEFSVEEVFSARVKRAVDGDHIASSSEGLYRVVPDSVELLFHLSGESVLISVVELHIEGLKSSEHSEANSASAYGSHSHAFQIPSLVGDTSNVPLAVHDLVVTGDEVSDEAKDLHHHVLSDRHHIGASHLSDRDVVAASSL